MNKTDLANEFNKIHVRMKENIEHTIFESIRQILFEMPDNQYIQLCNEMSDEKIYEMYELRQILKALDVVEVINLARRSDFNCGDSYFIFNNATGTIESSNNPQILLNIDWVADALIDDKNDFIDGNRAYPEILDVLKSYDEQLKKLDELKALYGNEV